MRPVLPGDVSCAARALLAVPQVERSDLAARLLRQAEAADRFRKRFGKAHPDWGNGSLMAVALSGTVADEPRWDNQDFLHCLILICSALQSHHTQGSAYRQVRAT